MKKNAVETEKSVILSQDSIQRISATIKSGAECAKVDEEGDLIFLSNNNKVGSGCGNAKENHKIVEIINARKIRIQVFNFEKRELVPMNIEVRDGTLDLREIVKMSKK